MSGTGGLRVLPMDRPEPAAVLRLVDARTRREVEVEPGYRRPLRVVVRAAQDRSGEPSDLRVRLVADVLVRTAELYGGQALLGVVHPGPGAEALEERAAVLGMRPPAAAGAPEAVAGALGGPGDVYITAGREASGAAVVVGVGAVRPYDQPGPVGLDPLALRLALLGHPYQEPVGLTQGQLAGAQRTLLRWRRLVAGWAQAPSKPMCAEILGRAMAGLVENLGAPVVLDAFRRLEEDTGLPDGSKFETFGYLDRVLALDVACEVGRVAGHGPVTR